jgi:endonuclease/exonuclease/phosphatase family metal-dependent hydrolase
MSTFRLATFNIENLEWARTHQEEFSRRLAALRPILRDVAADILCLQEVGAQRATAHAPRRFHALDLLLADGPYAGFHRATSTRPGGDLPADVHNLTILSRWPIGARRQVHHELVGKWSWTPPQGTPVDIVFDRPLLYACIEPPDGARLHVINLHLRAPRPVPLAEAPSGRALAEGQFLAAQRREGQALEARLFVEELFDRESDARIAVCGDLNADELDAPTRILTGEGARRLEPLEARVPLSERFSIIHAGKRMQVDQILASGALAQSCAEVAILNRDLQDEAFAPEPIVGSLHAPVVAAFRTSDPATR